MGRLKDTLAARGRVGAGGHDLVRVDARSRCPKCGSDTLCRIDVARAEVWCNRVADGALRAFRGDKGLRETWVHPLDGSAVASYRRAEPPAGAVLRAEPDDLDAMNRHLLGGLTLDPADRAELARRGLSCDDIAREGFRSMPERGRAAMARRLVERFGVDLARRLSGVAWRTDDTDPSRGWWSFAGWPGIIIPCRDLAGRIVALKVRRRGAIEKGARYTYVSSAPTGPSALAAAHVPAAALDLRATGGTLIVSEGELKATIATALSGRAVVSVPGVANWPRGVELARAWGASVVVVAFDADARTNPHVARHERDFLRALAADGFDARVWRWPEDAGNGLDDFLLRRREARTTTTGTEDHAE